MIYTYQSVANPVYGNSGKTQIVCDVYFDHLGTVVSFRADKNDCEAHGVQIFNECAAGKYGDVAAYVPPPVVAKGPTAIDRIAKLEAALAAAKIPIP